MDLYFAPLEGITTHIYRNAHAEIFGGCDAYYAPFITPSDNEKRNTKGIRDILPEKNSGITLKAQVLTNDAPSFLKFAEKIKAVGFDETNINLGCPSSTVVGKGRGAGFLRDTEGIDRFLYDIFSADSIKISVKTRIGFGSGEEMDELMRIYNKYPLTLLIIHPRTRADFYNCEPDMKAFEKAYGASKNKVCYNGDIFSVEDYEKITNAFFNLKSVMIGRGAIKNPALFREIKGGKGLETGELIEFTERLKADYIEVLRSEIFTLNKLKEIWMYIMRNFPEEKKILKAIKKANKLIDFEKAINCLPDLS